jgi:acetyl-CoA synthetase
MLDSAGRKAVPFNWALDWFDARLATETINRDRPALWIVEPDSRAQVKLSFAEHFAPSESSRELLRDLGPKRNDRIRT